MMSVFEQPSCVRRNGFRAAHPGAVTSRCPQSLLLLLLALGLLP